MFDEEGPLGKAILITPFYISIAWTLMISYQLFTQTAVTTVATYVGMFFPSLNAWLFSRIEMLVFIYAFAWVFLLSSVIPSVMLGKERSVLVQFSVCLTLTFLAFLVQDAFKSYVGEPIEQLFSLATFLSNPFLATCYLIAPYLFMLTLDIRSRKRQKKKEALKEITDIYLQNALNQSER